MSDRPVATVIFNPTKVDLEELRALVTAQESSSGWDPSAWLTTTPEDEGQDAARRALASGTDLVLVAGGDGTVRAVAEVLAGSPVSMALLPQGTGNLLAANLGLDADKAEDHIRIAFEGRDVPIDVGRIALSRPAGEQDSKVFVVMAGLGLDVDMIVNTNDALKAKVGWLAYVGGIIAALRRPTYADFEYSMDGQRSRRARANSVIVGNCGSLRGGIVLFPKANLSDGLLDLAIMTPTTTLDWWTLIKKVLWEHRQADATYDTTAKEPVDFFQGKSLTVKLHRPVEMELDGDSIGQVAAFSTWSEPASLTVRRDRRHVAR